MSGIVGLFYFEDRIVEPQSIANMCDQIKHRGADGISSWTSDSIGLGHCMLFDTPESLFEQLPRQDDTRQLVITYHGRIDNRSQLAGLTNWSKPLSETNDSELILAAYKRWGSDFVERLEGDFAFAVYDSVNKKLFCARDRMGVKPFYYYLNDRFFIFGSEIKALFSLGLLPKIMNKTRVADYLSAITVENTSTFFEGVKRLAPACYLEVAKDGTTRCENYFQFTPAKFLANTSEGRVEQFRDLFYESVRKRLRSAFPIGSYLSGGLDSSSIVCVASDILSQSPQQLHTFSGVFDTVTSCDEREFISSVERRYQVSSHHIQGDDIPPSRFRSKAEALEDEPFENSHGFLTYQNMSVAKDEGVRVMLDGHDGDTAISYGDGWLRELLLAGRLVNFYKECHKLGTRQSFRSTVRNIFRAIEFIISNSYIELLSSCNFVYSATAKLCNVHQSFAKQTGLRNRLLEAQMLASHPGQKEQKRHKLAITHPRQALSLEYLERSHIANSLISRYPFFDHKVIELCLALPAYQKLTHGLNRYIVRHALEKTIPVEIFNRKTKTSFADNILNGYLTLDRRWFLTYTENIHEEVFDYVNKTRYLAKVDEVKNEPENVNFRDIDFLLKVVSFSRWQKMFF